MKKNIKIELVTGAVLFVILAIYIFLILIFKENVEMFLNKIVPFFSWGITLTLGAILGGLIYKGGPGFAKHLFSDEFKPKIVGYFVFLLELILVFVITWFINFSLKLGFSKLVFMMPIVLIFWFYATYAWYALANEFKLPWLSIIIGIVLSGFSSIILLAYII